MSQHLDDIDGIIEIAIHGSLSKFRPIRQCCTLIGNQLILEFANSNKPVSLLVNEILKPRLSDSDVSIKVLSMLYYSELVISNPSLACDEFNNIFLTLSNWLQAAIPILRKTAIYTIYKLLFILDSNPQLAIRLNEIIERNIISIIHLIHLQYTPYVFEYAMNQHIVHFKLLALVANSAVATNPNLFLAILAYLQFNTNDMCYINFFIFLQFALEQSPIANSLFSKSLFLNQFLIKFDNYMALINELTQSDVHTPVAIIAEQLEIDLSPFIQNNPNHLYFRSLFSIHNNHFTPSLCLLHTYISHTIQAPLDLPSLPNISHPPASIDPSDPNSFLQFINHYNIHIITQLQSGLECPNSSVWLTKGDFEFSPISGIPNNPQLVNLTKYKDDMAFKDSLYLYIQGICGNPFPEMTELAQMLIHLAFELDDIYYLTCLATISPYTSVQLQPTVQSRMLYMLNKAVEEEFDLYETTMTIAELFINKMVDYRHLIVIQQTMSYLESKQPISMPFDYTDVLPNRAHNMRYMAIQEIQRMVMVMLEGYGTREVLIVLIETIGSIGDMAMLKYLYNVVEHTDLDISEQLTRIHEQMLHKLVNMSDIEGIKALKGLDVVMIDLLIESKIDKDRMHEILEEVDLNEVLHFEGLKKVMGAWYGKMCKIGGYKMKRRQLKKVKIDKAVKTPKVTKKRMIKGKEMKLVKEKESSELAFDEIEVDQSSVLEFDDISE